MARSSLGAGGASESSSDGQALRESEARLRRIAELGGDYCYSLPATPDGCGAVWVAGSLSEITGYTAEEAEAGGYADMVHPDDMDEARARIARLVDELGSSEHEFRIVTKSGEVRWIRERLRAVREPDGIRLYASCRDITEVRQAEAARQESEDRYHLIGAIASDMVAELDARGRVLYASPSHREIVGEEPEDVVGTNPFDRIHPDDRQRVVEGFASMLSQGVTGGRRYRYQKKSGEWMWLETAGSVFQTSSGETHLISISRDVTAQERAAEERRLRRETLESEVTRRTAELERTNAELRTLQRRLIEAERLAATSELAGQIAHSINNPLLALIGTLQMRIEGSSRPDPADVRLLGLARRIENVVRSMLAFSRNRELSLADLSPRDVIEQVHRELEETCTRSGVELRTRVDSRLTRLRADPELLGAALVAIVENAIGVSAPEHPVEISVEATAGGRGVEFQIADRGPGIRPEIRPRIFEPFFSARSGGTGLGLAIALGIVRGHRGRILTEDRKGGGTVFRVEIPLIEAAPDEAEDKPAWS